jgi:tetratricopeptide (TPR) repeat protein/transglutaminase-like putative cysteine protease
MRTAPAVVSLVFTCLPWFSSAQTQNQPGTDSYKNEALVFEKTETTYRMHADGTGERDLHVVMRIQSQGAAQQFGVLAFGYAAAYETPTIKLVRVHKADGTVVDTPPGDAIDMPADVSREAPLYSDLKEKHLPVRSLAPGDTLEYELDTAIDKAEAPGAFWGAYHLTAPGTEVVLHETLTLEFPADKYVQVWSPNHKPEVTEHDGLKTYAWNASQLLTAPKSTGDDTNKPQAPKDPDEDADGRKLPSVAWTTFHSWAEVGEWYRSLALSRAQPDDAVRAKAEALTKDAKTPEDQVRAIYGYVSQHNRYVGIDFGIGRYQPHGAGEVLANQYGDCKDKDTLLEALLHAKGFTTAPALIGVGIAPVPEVPSPAVFNHVITTVNLPGGPIWLDSTPPAAPFRYLLAAIRDQKALVIPAEGGAALQSTPAEGPYPFTARFEADATLDKEGKLTGRIRATYRDDDELVVRALAQNLAPADWDKGSQYISSLTGFSGTTSNTQFARADDTTAPIEISYDYAKHPYGDWDNLRILPLLPVTDFSALDSDTTAPEEDIQLGAARTLTAISRIRLPDGFHTDPPDAVHVKTDFATFDKTYKVEGQELVVERTITVLKTKLPKEKWKDYQTFTKDIGLTQGEPWIVLIPPTDGSTLPVTAPKLTTPGEKRPSIAGTPSSGGSAGKDSETKTEVVKVAPPSGSAATPASPTATSGADTSTDSATELIGLARDRLRAQDYSGAKQALDQAKAKNPNEPNLWLMYGSIADFERNFDEAKADFKKEVAAYPESWTAVMALSSVQQQMNDPVGAQQTVQMYVSAHPGDVRMAEYLSAMETSNGDNEGALKTLEEAANLHPDDRALRLNVSTALLHLHRNEEAAAAAMSVLDGTEDPELLNNAAYTLSETGLHLDVAEEASRRSVTGIEEKSATISTEEANSRTFADANLLIAAWDTLGWILFEEGKPELAKPLIAAAWRASLRSEIGDHLAQIDEAMGQKGEAARTYALAVAAEDRNTPTEVRTHLTEKTAAAHVTLMPSGAEALQSLRTIKVSQPAGVSGWGTFRIVVTVKGVVEAQQMSGESKVAGMKDTLKAMEFPWLLPPDSKAHLLRSAVVSCWGGGCEIVLVPDGGLQTERE